MDAVVEVKSRLNIEDVIGEYVQLKRAGRNFKGLSPFTNEKSPSFIVSPEKQIWHDFSSGRGGDMFTFVQEVEGLDFKGALDMLARRAGVDLEQFKGSGSSTNAQFKNRALEALELATKFYQRQLAANKPALEYLIKDRKFSKDTLLSWRLGYAPNTGQALTDFLTKHGFERDEMKRSGLVIERYSRLSDMFRGRIMVPLTDSRGVIIGFTARLLQDEPNAPKYINTPQTIVYDKGRNVFGLHLAKEAIRKTGFVVVVEGNMDVISSHQAGVANVVASAGTAMTENHLRELKRFTGDIRLCFDADRAGVAATERMIPVAQKVEVNLKIVTIDGAKDPDELVQKDVKLWQKAIEQAVYAPDWLIEHYKKEVDLKSAQGKRIFTDVLLATIRRLRDPVEQEHYLKKISEITETSLEAVQAKLRSTPKAEQPRQKRVKTEPQTLNRADIEYQRLQDHFLGMVLMQPKLRGLIKDCHPEFFTDGSARSVFKFLKSHPDFEVKTELDLQALHLSVLQGADEQRTEAYMEYGEGAAQSVTPQNAKNLSQQAGSAGRQDEMVQSLQDYVKIIVLQFEELYADLPPPDLEEQAQKLKHRLIDRYVKMQNRKITKAIEAAKTDEQRMELMLKSKKLNELIK
jgi:DNA primase